MVRKRQSLSENTLYKESSGYFATTPKKVEELLIPFNNKAEKWAYMKKRGLAERFLEIKKYFPNCGEPIISRKLRGE
jgi:hypothetical protein